MTNDTHGQFERKAAWHRIQRHLTPSEKVRVVIELQKRQASLAAARQAAGVPTASIVPWRTRP